MTRPANPVRWFDTSPEVIRLVLMMYVRHPLSLRNVEGLLFERSVTRPCGCGGNRFGPRFAGEIRRKRFQRIRVAGLHPLEVANCPSVSGP
jgi:putative transposase